MSTNVTKRFFISGRVQGVFYRESTRKKALQLGLSGWVKNLSDGRVECVACGEVSAMQALERWLYKGPITAKVTEVIASEIEHEALAGFQILR